MIIWALRDHEIGDPFTRDGDAVEDDLAGAHLDRIAGKADHAVDLTLLVGGRRIDDDAIAAGWPAAAARSEESRVGQERVRKGSTTWRSCQYRKNNIEIHTTLAHQI